MLPPSVGSAFGWGAFGDQYGSVIPSRFSHSDRSRKSFARTEPGAKDESPAAIARLNSDAGAGTSSRAMF